MRRFVLASILTLLWPALLSPAPLWGMPVLPGYVPHSYQVDDGLPNAGIVQLLQSRTGDLWIATFDGLARFDGVRFRIYRGGAYPALRSHRISELSEDRNGVLWITMEHGYLARVRHDRFTACGPRDAATSDAATSDAVDDALVCDLPESDAGDFAVRTDPSGRVWLFRGGRIFRADTEDPVLSPRFDLGEDPVRDLIFDRHGRLWILSRDAIRLARTTETLDPARIEQPGVLDLGVDDRSGIWISKADSYGHLTHGGAGWSYEALGESAAAIHEDPRGGLWLSIHGVGLDLVEDGRRRRIAADDLGIPHHWGPDSSAITSDGSVWVFWQHLLLRDGEIVWRHPWFLAAVLVDRDGALWIAGNDGGDLHAYHPSRVENLFVGLPRADVYRIYEDIDGTLWSGGWGLAFLAPGAPRFETLDPQARWGSMLRDREGVLWLSLDDGLRPFGAEPVLPWPMAALLQARDGTLWAGGPEGLFERSKDGRWRRFEPVSGAAIPQLIRTLAEDQDGSLWVGTNGHGVLRIRGGHAEMIRRGDGLASDHVRALHVAEDGFLWIATEDRGLSRLDPAWEPEQGTAREPAQGTGTPIVGLDHRHGLHADGIHRIVDDGIGHWWMSSNDGIFRVDREELFAAADAVAAGREARVVSVAYDERDGLRDREANGGALQTGLLDHQGRVLFPTMGGVVRLDPRELTRPRLPAQTRIESLCFEGSRADEGCRPLAGAASLRIPPTRRSFTLTYTAPSFRAPERLRFRYRLRPYENEWIDAGDRREASYTKVPPGRYTFEVRVLDEGILGDPVAITVEAPPRTTETWWFRVLALAAAAALIFEAKRRRAEFLRRRRWERLQEVEREVHERTAGIEEKTQQLIEEAKKRTPGPPRILKLEEVVAVPADQLFLEKIRAVIEKRMSDQDFSVEALAEEVGCERSYLLRRLRVLIDETPSGLIRTMRLERAAQWLRQDGNTVGEIAAKVGFKRVSHFSTAFFRQYGERPKNYAERHRKENDSSPNRHE